MNNTVITNGDIKGDITSCKIENQLKSIERSWAFSPTQRTTYMTYDVCNKEIITEYTIEESTGMVDQVFGSVSVLAGVVIAVIFARFVFHEIESTRV